MVTRFGMSEKMGPLQFGEQQEMVFLGRELAEQRDYSEDVAEDIDEEVRGIVERGYARTKEILSTHLTKLHAVAKALMDEETLGKDEFEKVLAAA